MSVITDKIKRDILNDRFSMVMVGAGDGDPGFIYTVGLKESFNKPEIIMFGLPYNVAPGLMTQIVHDYIRNDTHKMELGIRDDRVLRGLDVIFLEVDKDIDDFAFQWHQYYKKTLEKGLYVQMVWPDTRNTFPWEVGFDPKMINHQRILNKAVSLEMTSLPTFNLGSSAPQ